MQLFFSSSNFFLFPSSISMFIFFSTSSDSSSSSSGIRNRRALSLDTPSFFCPYIAKTWVGWWRDGAEVSVDRGKLTEGAVLTEGTDEVVVEDTARQVALVERRVGAAGEHREVHDVWEPAQHLLVHGSEVNCGKSCGRGRW